MELEEEFLIDRLNPNSTGVNAPIWISCEKSSRTPQVRAEDNGITFSLAIKDLQFLSDTENNHYFEISTPVLLQLQMWIRLNRQALLDYWNRRIDTLTFCCLMIRLPEYPVDVSTVNLRESRIFPEGKYKVQVRSSDSTRPHFHVISKDEGYDVRLSASSGRLLYVDQYGKRGRNGRKGSKDCFSDVVKSAKEWLELEPAHPIIFKFKSNREKLEHAWSVNHENDIVE